MRFLRSTIVAVSLLILLMLTSDAATIQPISRVLLRISPAEGNFSERFSNPPLTIQEGFQNELLVWRGAYLEVFSENGRFLRRLGGLGDGPGEFSLILIANRNENQYFILDLKGLVSVFNDHFEFQKRYFLRGEKNSNIIYDMDTEGDHIVTAQRWQEDIKKTDPAGTRVVSLYDIRGRFLKSFLGQKEGWKKYPNDSLLGGNVLLVGDDLYCTYKAINKIWKLDLDGSIIKENLIGSKWWHSITYNKRSTSKMMKKGGSRRRIYENIWATGDMISDISYYKNTILIHVLREVNGEAKTSLFILDRALGKEVGPLSLDGFLLSGVGEDYIYFMRYASEYSVTKPTEVEVLKCVLKD